MIQPGAARRGLLAAPEIEQQGRQGGDIGPVVALPTRPAHPLHVPGAGQVGIHPDLLAATGDREAAAFGDDDAEFAVLVRGSQILRGGSIDRVAPTPNEAGLGIGIGLGQFCEEQPEVGDEVDGALQIGFGEPTAIGPSGAVGKWTRQAPPF